MFYGTRLPLIRIYSYGCSIVEELYIDSVAHRYGDRQVLNNVYLTCKVGEVVGVLGRNGCGKSTLLKIIFGTIKPSYKHLKVNDVLVQKGYETKKISYLPQHNFIPAKLKIDTLLKLYINKYLPDIMEIELIKNNLKNRIGDLSGGQRRLVECLLILYSDSEFIILDEPFSQLAPNVIDEIHHYMLKLKTAKGFIVTDHYYQQILSISTRIVLIHNGCNYNINNEDDLILHGYLPSRTFS
ncbi:MAG: ATP-binding cassette domain-containing protein [Pedobacter sp.]|nr:MAG: ATP-binding cassette domain-containing protein [Pedobacter sp.]